MKKRLISFSAPRLTLKGFIIVKNPKGQLGFWNNVDHFVRHPAALIIIGFALSGIVGGWLTYLHEVRLRERDAIVKNMDDLRASIDDLSTAFSHYSSKAYKLIDLMKTNASPEALATAQAEFDLADEKWSERLIVDSPNIKQRFADSGEIYGILFDMQLGTGAVNECIKNHVVDGNKESNIGHNKLLCNLKLKDNKKTFAESRLQNLYLCVNLFATLLRPEPRNDFYAFSGNDYTFHGYSVAILKACGYGKIMGITD
ncbi:hypothetical protein [Collimonas arenae]|uniref:hypothetical protein n=1 Tax=Collimonas arenae TaxID=279058 RepID=UPI000FE143EE|nr:hypothetical protein [Collimonas arenae]